MMVEIVVTTNKDGTLDAKEFFTKFLLTGIARILLVLSIDFFCFIASL